MEVGWNLGSSLYRSANIYYITSKNFKTGQQHKLDEVKLRCLSHVISSWRVPALYLTEPPQYSEITEKFPVIVVFDLEQTFSEEKFPDWTTTRSEIWYPEQGFTQQHLNHLQKALTMRQYYDLCSSRPVFMTTFCIVPCTDVWPQPAALKIIPTIRSGSICLRSTADEMPGLVLGMRNPPPLNSYILLPPLEYPFRVKNVKGNSMSVTSPFGEDNVINIRDFAYILVANPPSCMSLFFSITTLEVPSDLPSSVSISFRPFNPHIATDEIITKFFDQKIGKKERELLKSGDVPSEQIASDHNIDISFILSELTEDTSINSLIISAITTLDSSQKMSTNNPLLYPPQPMDTFSSNTRSCNISEVPEFFQDKMTPVLFTQLNRPLFRVNVDGRFTDVNETIIDDWERNKYQPINGAKDGEYLVFYETGFNKDIIQLYFHQLTHAYGQLGFGKMIPFSQIQPFNECSYEGAYKTVHNLYSTDSIIFNRRNHTICYIVSHSSKIPFLNNNHPKFCIQWLFEDNINDFTDEDVRQEAFSLYSSLRNIQNAPISELYLEQSILSNFFFGFRYQHPFLLYRNSNEITIHIFWNPQNSQSIWCDEIGSILTVIRQENWAIMQNCMSDIKNICGYKINVNFSLTFIAESINQSLLRELNSEIGPHIQCTSIFNAYPSSYVQASFLENTKDDIFVESPPEFSCNINSAEEQAHIIKSGFVISKCLQAYQVGLIQKTESTHNSLSVLKEHAQQLYNLSWLTAKPNYPQRTISYPPPMAILLTESPQSAESISRYVFVPDPCKIEN